MNTFLQIMLSGLYNLSKNTCYVFTYGSIITPPHMVNLATEQPQHLSLRVLNLLDSQTVACGKLTHQPNITLVSERKEIKDFMTKPTPERTAFFAKIREEFPHLYSDGSLQQLTAYQLPHTCIQEIETEHPLKIKGAYMMQLKSVSSGNKRFTCYRITRLTDRDRPVPSQSGEGDWNRISKDTMPDLFNLIQGVPLSFIKSINIPFRTT